MFRLGRRPASDCRVCSADYQEATRAKWPSAKQLGAADSSAQEMLVNRSQLFYEPRCVNLQRNNKQSYRLECMWKHPGVLHSRQLSKKDVIKNTTCGGEPCLIDGRSLARYVFHSKVSKASWERSSRLSTKILPATHSRAWGLNLEMKDNTVHIFTIYSLFKVHNV